MIDFALRSTSILKYLSDEEWLAAPHKLEKFKKGQIVHLEEDDCTTVEFIVDGTLHVKRHDIEGRTLMVEQFVAGELMGANLLFSSHPIYPMTIIADCDASIIVFDRQQILSWCQSNAVFLEHYLREISDKTQVLVGTIKKLSTGTLREKLLTFLEESCCEKDSMVVLKTTKKELAERFGVARTSISRELKRMEDDGLIIQHSSKTIELC